MKRSPGTLPEELQQLFLKAHKEWEALNNPAGIASGKAQKAFRKRNRVLIALVRVEAREKEGRRP
ncbi:hypothetical protein FJY94_00260 [Candidatus Kaiserbacteria bacterium]|nr:hypothetical protein [Candidatus Kaiserbacteria bacterium]